MAADYIPGAERLKTQSRSQAMRRHAFTLVELLVSVAIISLLIGIILPALGSARATGRRTVCLANLHSISVAALDYLQTHNFPAYFDDAITLRKANYSYSWSDFLVKGRYLATEVDLNAIPYPDGRGGLAGVYLGGMVSQRAKIFQCPSQVQRVWGEVAGYPVSYRADFVATGHELSLPVGGIYKSREHHSDAELIWLGEAFTNVGGISTREYVRETQLRIDANEANPLRHAKGGNYLFGDGHAQWSGTFHTADFNNLMLPWESP